MKTITLKKLTLQDWRGQNKVINFGHNTEIKGRNKSGKSSCFNAWLWLLTGADEQDRINYKLFDDTLPLTYENSKLASAEAVLDIDGVEYTLKKTAKQGWTRKKGREEYEKKATDDYKFYIDSIERSAGDYKSFIEETFAPFDKLKLMLNIGLYQSLDWKEMRRYFEALVDSISMEDFKSDYSEILNDLNKYTIEEAKASYKSKIKNIKASIDSLPITIQTLQSNLPDITGFETIQDEINQNKEEIANIDKQILGSSDSIKPLIDKRNAELELINELKKEYQQAKADYELKPIEKANEIKAAISQIDADNAQIQRDNKIELQIIEDAKRGLESTKNKLKTYEDYRNVLLKENEELKAMVFEGEVCSFCGQPLVGDKLEDAKRKFFEKRDAKRASVVATGKANNSDIQTCKEYIKRLEEIISKGYIEKPLIDKTKLEVELDNLRKNFIPYKETIEAKEKLDKIASYESNLTVVPQIDNTSLQNMKQELLNEVEALSKKIGLKDEYDKQIQSIKVKQEELKENAVELANLEKKLNLVAKYEQERAQIVSDKVNVLFDYISVKMTSTNKSGEIIPDCQILDKCGVNSSVCNSASKVLCGIDLSLGFQKFYGLELPMFIDNSELVNAENYPKVNNQTIKLIVSNDNFNVEYK